MKKIYSIILVSLGMILSISMMAQNSRTAYFMESNPYRYRYNPSFIPENGHLGIVAGQIGASVESNLDGRLLKALSEIDYDTEDEKDFLNGISDVLKKNEAYLKDVMKVHGDANISLFSLGWHKNKCFNSLELNIRSDQSVAIPFKSVSSIVNSLLNDETDFEFGSVGLKATECAELSYGLAYKINDRLSVGGKVKMITGITGADSRLNYVKVAIDGDESVTVNSDGLVSVYLPEGISISNDFELVGMDEDLNEAWSHPAGYGAAFDFGATYRPVDGLTVAASVQDLGFISWHNKALLSITDGRYIEEDDMDGFLTVEMARGGSQGLSATINQSVEYDIPGAKGLSIGLVGTEKLAGKSSWSEGRFVINYKAPKVIELAASCAQSTFGTSFGTALNLNLGPVGIFAGIDSMIPAYRMIGAENGIPACRINTNAVLGLNIVFLRKHSVL